MTDQRIVHRLAALIVGLAVIVAAAVVTATSTYPDSPQVSASMAASASKPPPVYGSAVRCMTADAANDKLAARMAEDISASLASRSSSVGLDVTDNQTGISCWYQSSRYFISASVVKVTILAALLHKQMAVHQKLSHDQSMLCWEMITDSDDYAASTLWDEIGRAGLQQFLGLARMTDTKLGPGGYWGLTKITAADEVRLLRLITSPRATRRWPPESGRSRTQPR